MGRKKLKIEEDKLSFPYFHRLLNNEIYSLSKDGISSSGYVIDTLEAVLWSFLLSNNYEEAIIFTAINLGDDTDTIADLTGGLADIYYGFNLIQCLSRITSVKSRCYPFFYYRVVKIQRLRKWVSSTRRTKR